MWYTEQHFLVLLNAIRIDYEIHDQLCNTNDSNLRRAVLNSLVNIQSHAMLNSMLVWHIYCQIGFFNLFTQLWCSMLIIWNSSPTVFTFSFGIVYVKTTEGWKQNKQKDRKQINTSIPTHPKNQQSLSKYPWKIIGLVQGNNYGACIYQPLRMSRMWHKLIFSGVYQVRIQSFPSLNLVA